MKENEKDEFKFDISLVLLVAIVIVFYVINILLA